MTIRFAIGILVSFATPVFARPPSYEVVTTRTDGGSRAEVRFTDSARSTVDLLERNEAGLTWLPTFLVSPDRRWILCLQKTGSGENEAWLYRVDDAGRVFRLEQRLDRLAWNDSDRVSSLKFADLYHTGISDVIWTSHGTLAFTLRGSDAKKSGSGLALRLEYDLAKGTIAKP